MGETQDLREQCRFLQREFQTIGADPLRHVLLDWLDGFPDPAKLRFRAVAGPDIPDSASTGPSSDAPVVEPFGLSLKPEFTLASWEETKPNEYRPGRHYRHWVTATEGGVASLIGSWRLFRELAEKAGVMLLSVSPPSGVNLSIPAIVHPVERWLLALHEILKPDRKTLPWTANEKQKTVHSPDTIRLGGIGITFDAFGCEVLDCLGTCSADAIDRILSALPRTALVAGEAEAGQNEKPAAGGEAVLRQLEPAVRKAYLAFQYAQTMNGRRLPDPEAYDWLKENGIDSDKGDVGELGDYQLPAFDTWSRQLRFARNLLGEQKYTRRAGRKHGQSIAKGNQIEYQKGDEK
jgi:hypothetical protein